MPLPVTAQLKAHLASSAQTLCTIIRIARTDGNVYGFTDHDQDILYDDGSGPVTYEAAVGYQPKDIANADDLSVGNTEYDGILNSPSITEADLAAGLWDYAAVRLSYINWVPAVITGITRSGTTATLVLAVADTHLATGDQVCILGADQTAYNGLQTLTKTNTTHFTYQVSGSPTTPATGNIYLLMCALRMPGWKLGQVTVKRNQFTAEIRDIFQAYSVTIGELTQPGCRANLGDARCKVDLTPFTVTGTLTGVSDDGMTLYDTGRTEPGPAGAISIVSITKANPGVVTLASGGGANFSNGEAITISGCVSGDFATLNTNTIIRSLSGDTFDLGIDTSSFAGSYTANSGSVTPLGGESGYFDFGVITMTSGAANGFSQDVLSYVVGQWTLQLPFPYLPSIGDTYTMVAGCDKSLATCHDRFSNVVNMRGEPYLPGIDKIIQVGKQ